MPAPWTAVGTALVFPAFGCTSEGAIGFPSDGTKWVRIEAGGGAADPTNYAFTNNVAQTFTTGAAGTQLHLDVSFSTAEGPGNTTFNDFMAVSVSSGTTTTTLLTLETATASFPSTACQTFQPSTVKNTIVVDLATIFLGLTATTPVTLRVHCANGGDNSVPSDAYVDNAYLGSPPPPPIDINFVPAAGLWTLAVTSPGHPNAENYNLFALTLSNPQGTGPIFGINFDTTVLGEILSPLGSQPFHVLLERGRQLLAGPDRDPRRAPGGRRGRRRQRGRGRRRVGAEALHVLRRRSARRLPELDLERPAVEARRDRVRRGAERGLRPRRGEGLARDGVAMSLDRRHHLGRRAVQPELDPVLDGEVGRLAKLLDLADGLAREPLRDELGRQPHVERD